MSEDLLVPDRCRFLHQEQMDACKSYVYWHNIAKEVSRVDLKPLVASSYSNSNLDLTSLHSGEQQGVKLSHSFISPTTFCIQGQKLCLAIFRINLFFKF